MFPQYLTSQSVAFPPTDEAIEHPNGLLCIGGDLRPERLVSAYRQGIFPWFDDEDSPILWWSPNPRCVFPPRSVKRSRSTARSARRHGFSLRWNTAFRAVMQACADVHRPKQIGTWISPRMMRAYQVLHQRGLAQSVEVWAEGELVGGVYGVTIGRVFFGESMFSLRQDASKWALAWISHESDFAVLDAQIDNPHLMSLGAQFWPRRLFEQVLLDQCDAPGIWLA